MLYLSLQIPIIGKYSVKLLKVLSTLVNLMPYILNFTGIMDTLTATYIQVFPTLIIKFHPTIDTNRSL